MEFDKNGDGVVSVDEANVTALSIYWPSLLLQFIILAFLIAVIARKCWRQKNQIYNNSLAPLGKRFGINFGR
jgi:hypothetical protein